MSERVLENVNIRSIKPLATPAQLRERVPATPAAEAAVRAGREAVERVLDGDDPRFMAIVGPCSIHNLDAAATYAHRLKKIAKEVSGTVLVVMRAYFEKPRSVLGWKGLVNDPYLDDTFRIEDGLTMARRFLVEVAGLGLPAATEFLDTLTPQYLGDLVSWSAIGARTAEAQTHREMASGLSMPVGFKNGTDGSLEACVNGIASASGRHHFLGITDDGLPAVFATSGNHYAHVVLRGGHEPNFDAAHVAECERLLKAAHLPPAIVVDCSHANSHKRPEEQRVVLRDVVSQIENGNSSIRGIMLESFLEWGRQDIPKDIRLLRPGLSVTDACIDWPETESLLLEMRDRLAPVVESRRAAAR
ncbi:MAG: 3-deoxy-7-phosphoheptulonate synthase [Kiritimatiellae bacterium]|nr:3-deoxy-7-phosphoheptulonate synthase [Kiritimatiellia bacterium]